MRLSALSRSACVAVAGAVGGLSLSQALRADEQTKASSKEGVASFQRMAPQRRPSSGMDPRLLEMSRTRPVLVGIAGGTGSGKTTVASAIADRIGDVQLVHICHDSYYKPLDHLPIEERARHNFDQCVSSNRTGVTHVDTAPNADGPNVCIASERCSPDALDTGLLVEHLHQLRDGRSVGVPTYDFATHSRGSETQMVRPSRIILVEGILSAPSTLEPRLGDA